MSLKYWLHFQKKKIKVILLSSQYYVKVEAAKIGVLLQLLQRKSFALKLFAKLYWAF